MRRPYTSPQVHSRPAERCLVEGCERLEELASGRSAGGLCAAHRYRKKRGLPLEPPVNGALGTPGKTFKAALVEAALRLADVGEDDHAFALAYRRLLWVFFRGVQVSGSRRDRKQLAKTPSKR